MGDPLRGEWRTPQWLRRLLAQEFGPFTLDAAADASNAVCDRFLTGPCLAPSPCGCGLCASWAGEIVFVNPTFHNAGRWARKCHEESDVAHRIVAILPASTDTAWWDEHVRNAGAGVIPTRGRIQYDPPPSVTASTNRQTTSVVVWEAPRPWAVRAGTMTLYVLDVAAAEEAFAE